MDNNSETSLDENKIINKFKKEFHEQMGYYPLVMTKTAFNTQGIPLMTLKELTNLLTPYLPELYGKTLPLADKSRKRELVEMRSIYCYMARAMNYTLTTIGKSIGNRDHTTVINSLSLFNDLMATSACFRDKYQYIFTEIRNQYNQLYESPTLDQFDQEWYQSQPTVLSGLLPQQN